MLSRVGTCGLNGIDGFLVVVEADQSAGMPVFEMVGLPDAAVKESRERIRAAIANSRLTFPYSHLTVNLAPADVRKEGPLYDLPIALAILTAAGEIPAGGLKGAVVAGELALDGAVRRISGALPMVMAARARGVKRFFIPSENVGECSAISDVEIYPVASLSQIAAHLKGAEQIMPAKPVEYDVCDTYADSHSDIMHIKGHKSAKRALEIAAAGGHNLLMTGSPGSGKTMLARALPTILPELSFDESLEVTKIHSVSGLIDGGLQKARPFRAPHHTASAASIIGGGRNAMPGEISKAHNGVLFFDELPEFPRAVLEALRQPMEDGYVMVTRVNAQVRYPSRFMFVGAMNPCPCGYLGSADTRCKCTPQAVARYQGRVSGPLLDRMDLAISVESIPPADISRVAAPQEDSGTVRARVKAARLLQLNRLKDEGIYTNAQLSSRHLSRYCGLSKEAEAVVQMACDKFGLSTRAYTRLIKVGRTIADLAGGGDITGEHIAEAVAYRCFEATEGNA